jgi:photosystem II stability/assembly factor-like uncharacterized protein
MKKVYVLAWVILLVGCSVPSPTSSIVPENTFTVTSTFASTPESTEAQTPTSSPFLVASKHELLGVNAFTPISSTTNAGQMDSWVVGNGGFITHWGNYAYPTYFDSPTGSRDLYDVDFVSPDNGWIVGEDELILHWNGNAWEISKTFNIESGWPYRYDLYNVTFIEANDGWAAGCIGSEGGEYFLVYHWDGISWTEVSLSDERNLWACVHDIVALSSDNVWMTGTGWDMGKEYGVTMHWNGIRWERFADLNSYNIYSMSALSPDNIWAVTRYGVVLNWNGIEWSEKTQLDFTGLEYVPVIFARGLEDVFVAGNKIFHWDGRFWMEISSNSNIPDDMNIVDIVEGGISEGGNLGIYMLDSSGILYWFSKESFR